MSNRFVLSPSPARPRHRALRCATHSAFIFGFLGASCSIPSFDYVDDVGRAGGGGEAGVPVSDAGNGGDAGSILECAAGKADCDANAANGCETNLKTDADHCGTCATRCVIDHGTPTCSAGLCAVDGCTAPYQDCNGKPDDGCESNTRIDAANCGVCGQVCVATNGTASCVASSCQISCALGFGDCDANTDNGCEATLGTDSANCGACAVKCGTLNAASTSCVSGGCSPVCNAGFGACGDPRTGCDTALSTADHCGTCDPCGSSTPFCVNNACVARLNIAVVNATTLANTNANGASINVQHQLQTASGNYRLLVVGVTGFGNNASSAPTSVQYAGVNMVPARVILSGNQVASAIYYLADSALPAAAGTYTVLVDAKDNNTFALTANIVEFKNVEQGGKSIDSVAGTSSTSACSPSHLPSDAIGVNYPGDSIYTIAALNVNGPNDGTNTNTTSGQTITEQFTVQRLATLAGYLSAPNNPTPIISWSPASCNGWAHSVISIRPAVTP
jgi:hypothetical protein